MNKFLGINPKIAKSLLSSQYSNMLEYRVEIALWALSGILPFIMLSLWTNLSVSDPILSDMQISKYFLSAFFVRQFSVVWLAYTFEEDYLSGRLSPYLIQPLHPLWRYISSHFAEQITRIPFAIFVIVIFFSFNTKGFWLPNFHDFILGCIATFLSFLIGFLLQAIIACLCFWTEKASSLERLLFIPYLFFSGLLAPLSFFPTGIQSIAIWTPFPYLINFPANLIAGNSVNALKCFSIQLIWLILLFPLVINLWRNGVKKYTAMGS